MVEAQGDWESARRILGGLSTHLWPENEPALRARVVYALGLLIGAKLVNIQVPYLFKSAADTLGDFAKEGASRKAVDTNNETFAGDGSSSPSAVDAASESQGLLSEAMAIASEVDPSGLTAEAAGSTVFALLVGYGLARTAAAGMQEARNAVFATVA